MQERRLLGYIDQDDIPSSAQEVDFSTNRWYGNVLYIPLFENNMSRDTSGTTNTGRTTFPYYCYYDQRGPIAQAPYEANIGISFTESGSLWYTILYGDVTVSCYSQNGYIKLDGGTDSFDTTYSTPIRFVVYSSDYPRYIILLPFYTTETVKDVTFGTLITNNNSGTKHITPFWPNKYIKVIFSKLIKLGVYSDSLSYTVYRWPYPIYIDTES